MKVGAQKVIPLAQAQPQAAREQSHDAQKMGRFSVSPLDFITESLAKVELGHRCRLCEHVNAICVRERKIRALPIILSKMCPLYHEDCAQLLMAKPFYNSEETQQSLAHVFKGSTPLFKPQWNGSEFVCKIKKSELERQIPYFGAPMTFSFHDRPDVTIALGFKGVPWIYCSNPEDSAEIKPDGQQLNIVYRYGMQSLRLKHPFKMDRETFKPYGLHSIKILLSTFIKLFEKLPEGLEDFLNNPDNVPDSFEMYFDTLGDIHAINPPTRPFMWCEPATQYLRVAGQLDRDDNRTEGNCRNSEAMASTAASDIDAINRPSHPYDEIEDYSASQSTTRWQDDLSFQLTVTDPDNSTTYAQLGGLAFKEGKSVTCVFSDGACIADVALRETTEYIQFAKNFNKALENMSSDELLTIRIKPEIGPLPTYREKSFRHVVSEWLKNPSSGTPFSQTMAKIFGVFFDICPQKALYLSNAIYQNATQTLFSPDPHVR